MGNVRFSVVFTTGIKNAKLLEPRMGEAGLDIIDEIRETCDVPNIPLDNMDVDLSCSYYRDNLYSILLSEEIVRDIPLYKGKNQIDVIIPEGFLTKFYEMKFEKTIIPKKPYQSYNSFRQFLNDLKIWKIDNSDTYVSKIKVWFEINNSFLVSSWIADGCPTFWNISELKFKRLKIIELINSNFGKNINPSRVNIKDAESFDTWLSLELDYQDEAKLRKKVGLN